MCPRKGKQAKVAGECFEILPQKFKSPQNCSVSEKCFIDSLLVSQYNKRKQCKNFVVLRKFIGVNKEGTTVLIPLFPILNHLHKGLKKKYKKETIIDLLILYLA